MVDEVLNSILRKRIEKKYSQQYMGLQLEMSQSQYARLENGTTALRVDMLFKILTVLEIDYDTFFSEIKKSRTSKTF